MSLLKKQTYLLILILVLIFTAGCGDLETTTGGGGGGGGSYTITRIEISPSSVTLPLDGSYTFTAKGYTAGGSVFTVIPIWGTSGLIGTIIQTGVFTATREGTDKVYGTYNTLIGEATVTVTSYEVQSIGISPSPATVIVGESQQFTITVYDTNGEQVTVNPTWTVVGNIGSIDQNGLFIATGVGTGTVNATFKSLSAASGVTTFSTDFDITNPPEF